MKVVILSIGLALQFFSLIAYSEGFDKESAVADVKATTKAFGGALKQELVKALQADGPLYALQVCNAEAMPITAQIATDHEADVFRVSLKNRNPNNIPNEWQRKVLIDFDARVANGEDVTSMASFEVIELDNKKQVRFMKALPTEGACLACHGTNIGTEVKSKLDELYPADKAVGYSVGEVRGAIVVVKDYSK